MFRRYIRTSSAFLAVFLSGCLNLAPQHQVPPAPVSSDWPVESLVGVDSRIGHILSWRQTFTDPRLVKLIEIGLEENRDLLIAASRVRQAAARYRIECTELIPTPDISASSSSRRDLAPTIAPFNNETTHDWRITAGLTSYEIDFFGRVQNLAEAAKSSWLAKEQNRLTVKNTLIGQIVGNWFEIGVQRELLAIEKELLALSREEHLLCQIRMKTGTSEMRTCRKSNIASELTQRAVVERQKKIADSIAAMTYLIGSRPDEKLLSDKTEYAAFTMPAMRPGIPSEVLLGRPDIRQAEADLMRADAEIGIARAALFPSITLTTTGGMASRHLSDLFDESSGVWTFSPGLHFPIFSRISLNAELQASREAKKEALLTYEKAIQSAFHETSQVLSQIGSARRRAQTLSDEMISRRDVTLATINSQKYGASSRSEVILALQEELSSRMQQIAASYDELEGNILLWKALGGGALEDVTTMHQVTEIDTKRDTDE